MMRCSPDQHPAFHEVGMKLSTLASAVRRFKP